VLTRIDPETGGDKDQRIIAAGMRVFGVQANHMLLYSEGDRRIEVRKLGSSGDSVQSFQFEGEFIHALVDGQAPHLAVVTRLPDRVPGVVLHQLQVFEAESGKSLGRLKLETTSIDFALSRCGEFVAIGKDDGHCETFAVRDLQKRTSLGAHKGRAYTPVFSPDEKWILTWSHGGTARLYSRENSTSVELEIGGGAALRDVMMSRDGTIVAIADGDGGVHLFSTPSGKRIGAAIKLPRPAAKLGVSPKGDVLLTYGPELRLFGTRDGRPLSPMLLDADGGQLAPPFLCTNSRVNVWDSRGSLVEFDYSPATETPTELMADAERLSGHTIDESGTVSKKVR
jgi:WD40 repeat protein